MKNVLHTLSLLIVPFISLQAGDEDDVLRAEHELALCYQNSDAACIEQGVMEDYILINSRGKISTRADDLAEAKKGDPKYEIFANHDMKARLHGDSAVVTGSPTQKEFPAASPSMPSFASPTPS